MPAPGRALGPGARQRRHSPLVAALRVTAAFLSVLVLVASGVMWFLYRDFSTKVDRVNAIGATHDDVDGRDTNILLVGSDDRTNATPAELKELSTTEEVTNSTDTMILVHIPADGRKATAVSFPRDSWVTIPGCSGQHKLNSAYINGATDCGTTKADPDRGRQKLVQTISQLSGLKIDHYVEVDLLGFYRITKAIGGVQICLNQAQKDPFSGIDLPKGVSTIEGKQALAFVRQRHGLPRGDLDRIVRQQYFMSATFRKVTSLGVLTNPIKLKRLLDAVGSSMRMDAGLDPIQLAGQLRGLAAGNVTFTTIPTEGSGVRNGQDVILVDESAIPQFFESVINPPKPKTAVEAGAARRRDRDRLQRQRPVRAGRAGRQRADQGRLQGRRHRQRGPAGLQPHRDPVRRRRRGRRPRGARGGPVGDAGAARRRQRRAAGARLRLRLDRCGYASKAPAASGSPKASGRLPNRRRHQLHQLTLAGGRRPATPECMIAAARSGSDGVTTTLPDGCTQVRE